MTGRPAHAGIVGVDLSLTATGIAGVASGVGWHTTIRSSGPADATWEQRTLRLRWLTDKITSYLISADLVVIEGPSYGSSGRTFDRDGLWWAIIRRIDSWEIRYAVVPPASLKRYATGSGAAAKGAVLEATAGRYRRVWADGFGGNDNAADAAVLTAMGHDATGRPLAKLPETHRKALAGVTWPELHGA